MQSIAPSVTDQITQIYVFVDDYLKKHPKQAAWRRSNNDTPPFTDAEVITIGLLQGAFGCDTLKKTYQLVAANWHQAFPRLCSYGQFLARLHALSALVGRLVQAALRHCPLYGRLYMMDGRPIAVCKAIRHGRVRLLHEDGARFGKSSVGWYFGFMLHAIIHRSGAILHSSERSDLFCCVDACELGRAGCGFGISLVCGWGRGAGRPGLS